MYTPYYVTAIIAIIFFIAKQLISFTSNFLKLTKDASLLKEEAKADKDYEFIKGLY